MTSTARELVDFLSALAFRVLRSRTSFSKAFLYTRAVRRLSPRVSRLLYEASKQFLRDFIRALAYAYTSRYGRLYVDELEAIRRVSFKDIARAWICLESTKVVESSEIRREIDRFCSRYSYDRTIDMLEKELSSSDSVTRIAIEYSYPRWFVEELIRYLDESSVVELLKSMDRDIVWIRPYHLGYDIDYVIDELKKESIEVEIDSDIPYMMYVISSSIPIHETRAFREKIIVTQDRASALVVEALDLDRDDVLADLCTAPGMKLWLSLERYSISKAIGVDIDRDRILETARILSEASLIHLVDLAVADSRCIELKRCSVALVDAPCSDSGAIPRDPAIKLHLIDREKSLSYVDVQLQILRNAVRQCERVVYAVCSLLPHEGEYVVSKLVEEGLCEPIDLKIKASPSYTGCRGCVRTFSHVHRCQSFFIAHLRRAR